MNILDEIVAHKKKDLEERKATLPLAELEKRMPPPLGTPVFLPVFLPVFEEGRPGHNR
ncbi:hypothetical protein HKBW3S42_00901 [Candidatus Hakubella thermalkaliphila]|uniref:Uncharacterized protein n=1 Tax=Candidatus Hakubella thermalkaliphila TaxID=2754717 RepID=A0A6V8PK19_9ACTN|nr:hypothetical protein HKBW3S42_00901 [Candidatus Hakubella thermalkaliphila]